MIRAAIGPDAARYLHLGDGHPVPRPFHLRWLAPAIAGKELRSWWALWAGSWACMAVCAVGWRLAAGDGWARSLAVCAVLAGFPGILGPRVVIPVGVDMPALALAIAAAWLAEADGRFLIGAVLVAAWSGAFKETGPVVAALAAWSPWLLIGLAAPAARHAWCRSRGLIGEDPLGPKFQALLDHPVQAALASHEGRWRDGWLMVAPWGVGLVALYQPTWPVIVALAIAYAQLLVATDTVRLVHHVAGPVVAVAAVHNLPTEWLLLAVVLHVVWFRIPERI